jgi:hypothetical protein
MAQSHISISQPIPDANDGFNQIGGTAQLKSEAPYVGINSPAFAQVFQAPHLVQDFVPV